MISRLVICLLLCAGLVQPALSKPNKSKVAKPATEADQIVDFPLTRHQVRIIWAEGTQVECLSWAARSGFSGFMLCNYFNSGNNFTIRDQLTADLFNVKHTAAIWPRYYGPKDNLGDCEQYRENTNTVLGCLGTRKLVSDLKEWRQNGPTKYGITEQAYRRVLLVQKWVSDIPGTAGSQEASSHVTKEGQ
jgi:hypothetical protein